MIAELLRCLVEDQTRAVGDERGQGVIAIARRFEDIAAGDSGALQIARLAGHAELIFGAVVIGLQIRIAELGRKDAAGAADADDDDIGSFRGHVTSSAQALWLAPAAPSSVRA